ARVTKLERAAGRRKKAQRKLRAKQRLYEEILSAEPNAILLVDAKTMRVEEANDAAFNLYGYGREEFLKLEVADISAEPKKTTRAVRDTLKAGGDTITRRYHRKKNGAIFPAEVTAHAFALGKRRKICAVVRDVTEHRWAHEELIRIHAAVAGASDAVLIIDLNERAIYTNAAFHDMFGCTTETMNEAGVESIFTDAEAASQVLRNALAGKNWAGEVGMATVEGKHLTALVRSTPVLNDEERIIDVLLIFSD
ncbi:unnamed protein product, partial [marine sediment metagenome]